MSGLFISFEGVDGAGKTTQVNRLRRYVETLGREVIVTREPGGTPLGKRLRELLLQEDSHDGADGSAGAGTGEVDRRSDSGGFGDAEGAGNGADAAVRVTPRAEALMFAADRAQHVAEVIAPALTRGAVVISDRYIDSSSAYQAGGRELTVKEVRDLSLWATDGLLPMRTYLLDMDPAVSHARLEHGEDRMESAGDAFQRRTRQAFLKLAAEDPKRFCVVDANQPIDTVWQAILADFDTLPVLL